MSSPIHVLRKHIHPLADRVRGTKRLVRASDIILAVMVGMGLVALVAHALTAFFAA